LQINIRFLGAAQNVTGSRHLVEANGRRFLVDCGLFQERVLKDRNWQPFPVSPESIDAVMLTHAHIDHSGFLPALVRDGFRGPIYCTAATADITRIMLLDSAHIQEEDAAFKKRRHEREGRRGPYPEIPLYTTEDAERCISLLTPISYKDKVTIDKGLSARFHDAGHVFGSAMVTVEAKDSREARTLLFSGDLGRWNKPILHDPTIFEEADYVVVESTYGDRLHEGLDAIGDRLAEVINSTVEAGGNIVIPSFALERSQEIMYYMNRLLMAKRIPRLKTFIDSPMAVRITEVFEKYPELHDEEVKALIRQGRSPFGFLGLSMVTSTDDSKAINNIKGSVIIVAGSGMCTGGRIKHHLVTNISRRESTILFVGYQASGTLGRHIVNGASEVRVLGRHYPVRARIVHMHNFSAHADRDGLLRWLLSLKRPPRRVFVVHGEAEAASNFAYTLRGKTGWDIRTPQYLEEAALD